MVLRPDSPTMRQVAVSTPRALNVFNMAYGRLLNSPASIAALIKDAYVDPVPFRATVRRKRQLQYARFGARNLLDAMPSIGRGAFLKTPIPWQDQIAAGGGGVCITSSPSASDT
jgi:hypothetical protein